jgi:hypothetical protein
VASERDRQESVSHARADVTHRHVRRSDSRMCAQVYAKVRVADVLPSENSGVSKEEYSFAQNGFLRWSCGAERSRRALTTTMSGWRLSGQTRRRPTSPHRAWTNNAADHPR